jgi:propanediol utilization protein
LEMQVVATSEILLLSAANEIRLTDNLIVWQDCQHLHEQS